MGRKRLPGPRTVGLASQNSSLLKMVRGSLPPLRSNPTASLDSVRKQQLQTLRTFPRPLTQRKISPLRTRNLTCFERLPGGVGRDATRPPVALAGSRPIFPQMRELGCTANCGVGVRRVPRGTRRRRLSRLSRATAKSDKWSEVRGRQGTATTPSMLRH